MHLLNIHEPGQTPLPHAGDDVAVGIDLGTTHSVVAIARHGQPEAITDVHGVAMIPSVVCYASGKALVGCRARDAVAEGCRDTVASVKRIMGKSGKAIADLAPMLAQEMLPHEDGVPRLNLPSGARSPIEISADILRHVQSIAAQALGKPVTRAVITVPAYFDDAARTATKQAAELAGIQVLRLLNEPTAAALAYGLDSGAAGIYVVYDLGGGTFDLSVLKLQQGVFQVLATAGDTWLGGDDIDHALAAHLSPSPDAALLALCRQAKETLSSEMSTQVTWQSQHFTITRETLENLSKPFIARTLQCAERALMDAKLLPTDIAGVVLVGGATRMPYVKAQVEAFFEQKPHDEINPDLVVAMGAAIQAEALTAGGDHVLIDVLPLSLGMETMGGIVEKIVHRNSPIPCQVSQTFTTYQDGQTAMKLHVLQGEREQAQHCRSLAEFTLSGIPPMVAGMARIEVCFTVDADGLLTVSAEEKTSGVRQEVAVKPAYGLSLETMASMLEESMKHAQADILARLWIEAKVEAERLMLDVRSAIMASGALLKPGEQAMMEAQMETIRRAMQSGERDRLDYEVAQLNEMIGPFAERRMNAAIQQALAGKHVASV